MVLIYIHTKGNIEFVKNANLVVVFLASASQNTMVLFLLMWGQSVVIVPITKGFFEVAVQPKKLASKLIPFGPKNHVLGNMHHTFFPKLETLIFLILGIIKITLLTISFYNISTKSGSKKEWQTHMLRNVYL